MKVRKVINNNIKNLIGLLPPKAAINVRYFIVFKKLPNLKNPRTLNEKINVYKLDNNYDFSSYADKVAVKDYVAEKIGNEYNIPTIYAGTDLPPVEQRTWELPYIIKMNNCSGRHIFVRTESERNWKIIDKKISKWKKSTFGTDSGEIHYKKIEPKVLVEKFISEKDDVSPVDYKIYVFNGKAEFIDVIANRENNRTEYGYDTSWNRVPFTIGTPHKTELDLPKPKNLDQMIRLAETLSTDFPLVRVDFYNIDGKIFFGEMTFTPAAGFERFYPDKYDYIFGEKLKLY